MSATQHRELTLDTDGVRSARSVAMERRCGPCAAVARAHGPHSALLGTRMPPVELPWTTALHNPAISWISATLDPALVADFLNRLRVARSRQLPSIDHDRVPR